MVSLRKLFRRKRHNQSLHFKSKTRNQDSGGIHDNTRPTHRIHVIEGSVETRSEEACRSRRRDMGIPEDRVEELDFDDEYEFMDEFPFDSCLYFSSL
jgi:hypothetical protein